MASDPTSTGLARIARRIEEAPSLDRLGDAIDAALPEPVRSGPGRTLLAGSWLGHSLHPLVTDLPIGLWSSASVLDLVGGPGARPAARRLVGLGILASLPASLTGLSDWAHLDRPVRRVGVAHALANGAALGCYVASYRARRRDPERGGGWALAGAACLGAGGFLGADLALTRAVTRDNRLL